MFETGRFHTLHIHHIDGKGAWLDAGDLLILLPGRELPSGAGAGDSLSVFVYLDGAGDLVSTLKPPMAQVGDFALLKVRQVSKPGAFLEWGLEKDLLVPFSEQPERMRVGRSYIVRVCRDSLGRLVGTARIDRCLETEEADLQEGQEVDVMIWQFTDLGAKVIVNNLYGGLLYKDEIQSGIKRGDRLKGYIRRIREDLKIDVSLRRSGAAGVGDAKDTILKALQSGGGFLPLCDQSPPWEIQKKLGLSKKVFKKAVGGLYKAGTIELTDEGIRLRQGD